MKYHRPSRFARRGAVGLGSSSSHSPKATATATATEMALRSGLRSGAKLLFSSDAPALSRSAARHIHSTGVKRMSDHAHDEPFYLHAANMYNLDRMKHQGLKMSLGVLAAVSVGVFVPLYAVSFQQKKAKSA